MTQEQYNSIMRELAKIKAAARSADSGFMVYVVFVVVMAIALKTNAC